MPRSFIEHTPTKESCFRSIILIGRNVASYKFALAKSLWDLAQSGQTLLRLHDLADPFSQHICEALKRSDKQITSRSSKFLDACMQFNRGEIQKGQLVEETVRRGFVNVIDAFHIVGEHDVPIRFFTDDRQSQKGIILKDEFFQLANGFQWSNFPNEIDARWRLVETAWKLEIPTHLLCMNYDDAQELLYIEDGNRRKDVTGARGALNGYQKGKCFYCGQQISILSRTENLGDVDHFFPHSLNQFGEFRNVNLNGIWNLVLACTTCNGSGEKGQKIPLLKYLERLDARNEYFILSHHPLRETLMGQTGKTPEERQKYLQKRYNDGMDCMHHHWSSEDEQPFDF